MNAKINEINELKTEIGVKDAISLKPSVVEIVDLKIEAKGKDESKILVCNVKHPDAENLIKLSGVQWINPKNSKVEDTGLWFNLDEDKKIRKGSALAVFLNIVGVPNISGLVGKKVQTCFDSAKQFIVFKGY